MDPTKWNAPFSVVVCALFVIVFCRANATYWVGRALAAGGQHSRFASVLERPSYLRAANWIRNWGAPAVAVSFLTIGFQTMANLAAGVARMPLHRYLIAVFFGGIGWAVVYGTVGFVGITSYVKLWEHSPVLAITLPGALLISVMIMVALRRRKAPQSVVVDQ